MTNYERIKSFNFDEMLHLLVSAYIRGFFEACMYDILGEAYYGKEVSYEDKIQEWLEQEVTKDGQI